MEFFNSGAGGGSGTGDAGTETAGAGVMASPASNLFSQDPQMGFILSSSPRQSTQKKRWQWEQFPTAARSG